MADADHRRRRASPAWAFMCSTAPQSDRPDETHRALSKARAMQAPAGDTTGALIEFEERRHRHARHHAEDAVRVAGRGLRRKLLGGERQRDAFVIHRAGKWPERSTIRRQSTSAAIWIISPKPARAGTFPITPEGILQTAAALEAVFKSVDADGAWMAV